MHFFILSGLFTYLLTMPVWWIPIGATWHDQQRWFQLFLLAVAAVHAAWRPGPWHPLLHTPAARWALAVALGAGLLSCTFAAKPGWAALEVVLLLGLIHLALYVAWIQARQPTTASLLAVAMGAVAVLLAAQTLAALLGAYIQRLPLDPWLLLSGFSNIRFFGQTITATAPLVVAGWMMQRDPRCRLVLAALAVLWCWIGWLSGTRGTWLAAVVCAATAWWLPHPPARQWAHRFVMVWLAGLALYALTHGLMPRLLAVDVVQPITERLTLDSSGRWPLWQITVQQWWGAPWLGIGPMHLANISTLPVAHPHNIVLQWLAEWGTIATLAWVLLLGSWLLHLLWRVPRGPVYTAWAEGQRMLFWGICMGLWGSAFQSLVDGNWVMPYPQTLIAVLAGLAMGMTAPNAQPLRSTGGPPIPAPRRWIVVLRLALLSSVALLLYHLWTITPTLPERHRQCQPACDGQLRPRLWSQGMIAWDNDAVPCFRWESNASSPSP